jgi:hypothetical protein
MPDEKLRDVQVFSCPNNPLYRKGSRKPERKRICPTLPNIWVWGLEHRAPGSQKSRAGYTLPHRPWTLITSGRELRTAGVLIRVSTPTLTRALQSRDLGSPEELLVLATVLICGATQVLLHVVGLRSQAS